MTHSTPVCAGRPNAAELLADASEYHLTEAVSLARDAARHLLALAATGGISPDQRRRLRNLAGGAAMVGDGAQGLVGELGA
jgi:hypothetical protein